MRCALSPVTIESSRMATQSAQLWPTEQSKTPVLSNEALLAWSRFSPRACWIGDPESKGKVESGVKYVKKGFFYGLEWTDIDDLV